MATFKATILSGSIHKKADRTKHIKIRIYFWLIINNLNKNGSNYAK